MTLKGIEMDIGLEAPLERPISKEKTEDESEKARKFIEVQRGTISKSKDSFLDIILSGNIQASSSDTHSAIPNQTQQDTSNAKDCPLEEMNAFDVQWGQPYEAPGSHLAAILSGNVQISSSDDRSAYECQVRLRDAHMRRLLKLEHKLAVLGILVDPSIEIEAEDIREQVAALDEQITAYEQGIQMRVDRVGILSEDKQRAALAALSRITGIPADQIKLVDIVLGSVVLVIEMPIAGAARLIAMEQLRHPMLRKQGFAKVALDDPPNKLFDQALSLELVKLDAETPENNEPLPYPLDRANARLRITLAEEGE